ncbi:MAG: hypothetical protein Q9224_007314, partial [Gallowayella concinna]
MDEPAPSSTCEAVDSAFTSPVFCIYAGSNKQQFSAHAQLLAKSATLRKIVQGEWKDSNDRMINLKEWDSRTVQQLLEWLYTGQYNWTTVEKVDHINNNPDLNDPATHAHAETHPNQVTPDHGDEMHEVELSSDTNSHRPASPQSIQAYGCEAARATGCTLMLHAKVYVLAQYLQLDEFKQQAFHNIEAVLSSVQDLKDKPLLLTKIVDLIRYIYNSTDSLINSNEPLRELVSTFAADWFRAFDGSYIDSLLAEGGDFVVDLANG